jgi:hypothetical protein
VLTKYLSILLIVFLLFYYPKFTVQPLTKNRHFSQFTAGAETCEPAVEPPDADLYGPRSEGPVLDAVARSIKQLSGGVLLQMPSTFLSNEFSRRINSSKDKSGDAAVHISSHILFTKILSFSSRVCHVLEDFSLPSLPPYNLFSVVLTYFLHCRPLCGTAGLIFGPQMVVYLQDHVHESDLGGHVRGLPCQGHPVLMIFLQNLIFKTLNSTYA